MDRTRRHLLGLVGGLAVGGLAGCSGSESTPTDSETATSVTVDAGEEAGVPDWTRWAPSRDTLGIDGGYTVLSLAPVDLGSYSDTVAATLDEDTGIDGVGRVGAQRRALAVGTGITGFVGDHDTDRVRSSLTDRGLTRQRTVEGLDIYAAGREGPENAVAVGPAAVFRAGTVGTRLGVDAVAALAAVARETDRFPASGSPAGTALDAVAPGEVVAVRASTPAVATVDGADAEGFSLRFGREETTVTAAFVGDGVTAGAVRSWADGSHNFESASPTLDTSGTTVTASATVPTGDVISLAPDWRTQSVSAPPQVQWSAHHDREGNVLEITHEGGDTVDPGQLYVRGSGFADVEGADQTAPGPWQGPVRTDSGVAAGDTVTVGVTDDYDIRLVYEFPDSDRSAVLFETTP